MIPVIDVFAGPGGLGEGFSVLGDDLGNCRFRIVRSIEKEESAHRTLLLRTFFRQFSKDEIPNIYYEVLRGEKTLEDFRSQCRKEYSRAESVALKAELGKDSSEEISAQIRSALGRSENWVLIGGPPCQPYSLAGRSRRKGIKNYRPSRDQRNRLYIEYLRIIAKHWPAVFVFENVKGLVSSTYRRQPIFDDLLSDLEDPGRAIYGRGMRVRGRRHEYNIRALADVRNLDALTPHDFVLKSETLGVPQARHRIIILGVRDDLSAKSRRLSTCNPVPISRLLTGLPTLRSGLTDGDCKQAWLENLRDARGRRWFSSAKVKAGPDVHDMLVTTVSNLNPPRFDRGGEFIRYKCGIGYKREWFLDSKLGGVCNHATRSHMARDLHRYLYAACYAKIRKSSPRLADFPTDLLPAHENVSTALEDGGLFSDRFRVQLSGRPATTITSHISKDGHYYIHPDPLQCRSLTVREAARIQTFPDNYFFMGPRTAQYIQVGNAVPPLMARLIAEAVFDVFKRSGLAR